MKVSTTHVINTGMRAYGNNKAWGFEWELNGTELDCVYPKFGTSQLFDWYHGWYWRSVSSTQFVCGRERLTVHDRKGWDEHVVRHGSLLEQFLAWKEGVQRR